MPRTRQVKAKTIKKNNKSKETCNCTGYIEEFKYILNQNTIIRYSFCNSLVFMRL